MMSRRNVVVCLLIVCAAGLQALGDGPLATAAPAAAVVIPATITSASPDGLVVSTQNGPIQVKMTAQTRVQKRVPAGLEDIKVGDYVGAAARREANGSLTAVYINVFQGGLRAQIPQGQSSVDAGNVMTNAVVTDSVAAVSGRTLTLALPGGPVRIDVPPGTEIARQFVTTRADLKAGRNVTVRGTQNADGSVTATSITINPH